MQGIGDTGLAQQCFRLVLSANNDHAEGYNNLGVLELRKGHVDQVMYKTCKTYMLCQALSRLFYTLVSNHKYGESLIRCMDYNGFQLLIQCCVQNIESKNLEGHSG